MKKGFTIFYFSMLVLLIRSEEYSLINYMIISSKSKINFCSMEQSIVPTHSIRLNINVLILFVILLSLCSGVFHLV